MKLSKIYIPANFERHLKSENEEMRNVRIPVEIGLSLPWASKSYLKLTMYRIVRVMYAKFDKVAMAQTHGILHILEYRLQ